MIKNNKDGGGGFDPFDFVEPCEPECTPERHAYHQGQWDMAGRINKHFGATPNPGEIELQLKEPALDTANRGDGLTKDCRICANLLPGEATYCSKIHTDQMLTSKPSLIEELKYTAMTAEVIEKINEIISELNERQSK